MGYLLGLDEDVFISYAHNDDDKYPREKRGWVAQLQEDLQSRIKFHLGMPPRLWRDCEIRNNEDFAMKISARLAKTAILLSVISHNFLERPWCQRELKEFCENAERTFGIRIAEKQRILKVVKHDVPREQLPPQFNGTGKYNFFGADPEKPESVHEFRPSLGEQQWKLYFDEMDGLAKDIAGTLKEMKGVVEGSAIAISPACTVYLAETTEDQDNARKGLLRDLQDRKFTVLPAGDLPYRGRDFKEQVRQCLQRSALSIHLIGENYGFIPEGETRSDTWLQHALAMERGQDPAFVRLIWMPSGLKPADPRQQELVDYLTNNPGVQERAEILRTTLGNLKAIVQGKLQQIREEQEKKLRPAAPARVSADPAATTAKYAQERLLRIYLICDRLDRESGLVTAVKKFLFSKGFEVLLPSESEDEGEALKEHTDNLALCDAYFIYYGQGSEKWFNTKLKDFRKILSGREQPVLGKAVYLAPPETASKSELETHEAMVLRGAEPFSPDVLIPFLNRLRGTAHSEST